MNSNNVYLSVCLSVCLSLLAELTTYTLLLAPAREEGVGVFKPYVLFRVELVRRSVCVISSSTPRETREKENGF